MQSMPHLVAGLVITTLVGSALACTSGNRVTKDPTGAICQVVVQDNELSSAPLCATIVEVETSFANLAQQQMAVASSAVAAAQFTPTQHQLYQSILANRAGVKR